MKILAFAASSSKNSINKALVSYAANVFASRIQQGVEVEILDLNDYEMPIYSIDRENESGVPELAKQFKAKISQADALLISFAEHNGHYAAAFKNIFDWASRLEGKVYQNKPAVIFSTSPGGHGAANVMQAAVASAPHFDMDLKASLSVASFYDNFDMDSQTISNPDIEQQIEAVLRALL
jgi:NAD(P)H-dependent FMN reductase